MSCQSTSDKGSPLKHTKRITENMLSELLPLYFDVTITQYMRFHFWIVLLLCCSIKMLSMIVWPFLENVHHFLWVFLPILRFTVLTKYSKRWYLRLQKLSEDYTMKDNEVVDLQYKLADVTQIMAKYKNDISRKQAVIDELEQRVHGLLKEIGSLKESRSSEKQLFERKSFRMSSNLQDLLKLRKKLDEKTKRYS